MAYAAAATLKHLVGNFSRVIRPVFRRPCLEFLEEIQKQIQSFEEFLNGCGIRRRKKMKESLKLMTESLRTLYDILYSHLAVQIEAQADVIAARSLYSLEVESIKPPFHELFKMIKIIKEIYGDSGSGSAGNKSKMVGLSEEYNIFKVKMVLDVEKSNVCFIVGMAGIGKTALAEAIFKDLDMVEWFKCRVWVSVGKNCGLEEIAPRILAQLNRESARKLGEGDGDAGAYLEEILKEKRYLIVLDDVWDARVRDLDI